jgi:hypothetical protein
MEHRRDCRVLDVSGDGARLRTNQHMPVGEVVCLGFHEYILVVRIRNSRPQGETFAVGAERICSFPKEAFGAHQPTFGRLQELLAEKGWDIEESTAAFVIPQPAAPQRSWRIPLALAALTVIIFAGLYLLKHLQREPEPRATPAPVAAEPAPPPVVTPQPTAAPSLAVHHVKVAVLEPAWLTASADGKPLPELAKTYGKNDSMQLDFSKIAYLHLGNSRGVQIVMDGKTVTLAEPHAVVGVLELTPSGSRLLPWTNNDPVAAPVH